MEDEKIRRDISCVICEGRNIRLIFSPTVYYDIVKCAGCGTIFRSPLPSEEELKEIYSSPGYFSHKYFEGRRHNAAVRGSFRRTFDLVKAVLNGEKDNLNILDIGCDTGTFLKSIPDDNTTKFGVEISNQASEIAVRNGFNIFHGDFFKIDFPHKFDMIFANDLWEHMRYPRLFLAKLKDMLPKGGAAYLTFPLSYSVLYSIGVFLGRMGIMKKHLERLFPAFHIFYPSISGVRQVLTETGFDIVLFRGKTYEWSELVIDNPVIKIPVYLVNKTEKIIGLSSVWEVIVRA